LLSDIKGEKNRVTVLQRTVLRRIFGCKRDKVRTGWEKLQNEELHNMYSSPNIIRMIKSRRMRSAGNVVHMGSMGKPEGKRPLGRPSCRYEENIKMDLREIVWGGMEWTDVAQEMDQWRTLVNMVMNLRVP
jgi:hypothetical protein